MSDWFAFASSLTREHGSIATKGKTDSARTLRELARVGTSHHEGVFYSLKREDGRYLASIDNPIGIHGFYGAPTKHDAMEWLAKKIDPSLLPLCMRCHEHQCSSYVATGQERSFGHLCIGCEDLMSESSGSKDSGDE